MIIKSTLISGSIYINMCNHTNYSFFRFLPTFNVGKYDNVSEKNESQSPLFKAMFYKPKAEITVLTWYLSISTAQYNCRHWMSVFFFARNAIIKVQLSHILDCAKIIAPWKLNSSMQGTLICGRVMPDSHRAHTRRPCIRHASDQYGGSRPEQRPVGDETQMIMILPLRGGSPCDPRVWELSAMLIGCCRSTCMLRVVTGSINITTGYYEKSRRRWL